MLYDLAEVDSLCYVLTYSHISPNVAFYAFKNTIVVLWQALAIMLGVV